LSQPHHNATGAKLVPALTQPVDGASLAVFRIMFGMIMAWFCLEILTTSYLYDSFIQPKMLFKYYGFGWVRRMPLPVLYAVAGTMLVSALALALGAYQRFAAAVFGLGWTYLFLLEKAYYINHFYLISLLAFLFFLNPPHGAFTPRFAGYAGTQIPAWSLWSFRAQFVIVYFYAGLAKIQPDWLSGQSILPFLGPYFENGSPALDVTALAVAWAGMAFDLLIAPALLWRRTRVPAALFAVGFHLANRSIFNIDVFPWLAMAGTLLFFAPDWPRQVLARFKLPAVHTGTRSKPPGVKPWTAAALTVYFAIQLLVPFQRFLYPGNSNWTEEGQKFTWQLMMKYKRGNVDFTVVDRKSNQEIDIIEKRYLNDHQIFMMMGDPDLHVQFAHYLAHEASQQGANDVAVYADTELSLNGRPKQRLVPPDLDLSTIKRSWRHYDWVIPLQHSVWQTD
jgi:vitamin K-dependent gamma-carboxylase